MASVEASGDSSFFVSLYSKDQNSPAAGRFIASRSGTLGFSPLNRIEVRNALRNLCARGAINETERRTAFRQMEEDLESGFLLHMSINWTQTFRRADHLSEQHAARDGQRAIDLLHVAIALEFRAATFLSFDQRQRKLAAAAGLKVKP